MKKLCTILLLSIMCCRVFAVNLGVYGQVYPISEPDILDLIHQRLDDMQKDGQLQALQDKLKKSTIAHVLRPTPVAGIKTGNTQQTFYFDPTFIVPQNVYDNEGHLIAKGGLKINPLKTASLNEALIFVNADDTAQVDFARKAAAYYIKLGKIAKIILINGNMQEAGTQLGRVYFDQSGVLTSKFGIKQVPAILTQEGLKLRIDEYPDSEAFPLKTSNELTANVHKINGGVK